MTYAEWEERVLAANRLDDAIAGFVASKEAVWHLDRHVLEVDEAVPELSDVGLFDPVGCAALSLFRAWDAFATRDRTDAVLISRPVLVIDDGWLDGETSATPPHVLTTIARHPKYFTPHILPGDERAIPKGLFGLIAGSGLRCEHVSSEDGGAWIIWNTQVETG